MKKSRAPKIATACTMNVNSLVFHGLSALIKFTTCRSNLIITPLNNSFFNEVRKYMLSNT